MIYNKKLVKTLALAFSILASSNTFAGLIDLSTWEADGNGNWSLSNGNNTATQSINGSPTIFFENGA